MNGRELETHNAPAAALRHHVSGAVERGETSAIVERPAVAALDLTFPADLFAASWEAVAASLSKDDSRAVLTAVHVEVTADAVHLVTTDTFTMVHVTLPRSGPGTAEGVETSAPNMAANLYPWKATDVRKLCKGATSVRYVDRGDSETLTALDASGRMVGSLTVGKLENRARGLEFPMYASLIERAAAWPAANERVGLDPKRVAVLFGAADKFRGKLDPSAPVVLESAEPLKPCRVRLSRSDGAEFVGVIMPVKLPTSAGAVR